MPAGLWRAKLYALQADGNWEEKDSGMVSVVGETIVLQGAATETVIPIANTESYMKQADAILTWVDSRSDDELAFSFQLSDGRQEVWYGLLLLCIWSGSQRPISLRAGKLYAPSYTSQAPSIVLDLRRRGTAALQRMLYHHRSSPLTATLRHRVTVLTCTDCG
jgi:hypothetical protein